VEHSVTFYLPLKRAKIDSELHIYAVGGHGFVVRRINQPCDNWTRNCVDWLRSHGMLTPASRE
jgi:hypothetical protein